MENLNAIVARIGNTNVTLIVDSDAPKNFIFNVFGEEKKTYVKMSVLKGVFISNVLSFG